jgi:ketosteroid isomerase-like protein
MNTQDVANRLVELCRGDKNRDAINELYDENVVSTEPNGSGMHIDKGKQAVLAKNQQWYDSVEVMHGFSVSDPIVASAFFACTMEYDVTFKGNGRMKMNEIALYEVKDGKIISDQFFYKM